MIPGVASADRLSEIADPPLRGFKVVELGQYIAVPGAAQIFADQGATVVKVEPPGGEACRNLPGMGTAMFAAYNRGKAMVELDLSQENDQRKLDGLLHDADLVLSNMKPGALEKYGFAPARMHEVNASLVIVTLSGFGESGAIAARPGLDIAAQAESGIMWVTGEECREPQRVGFPAVDALAAVTVAQAATTALLSRTRDGRGAHIRLSLWDIALHFQATNYMDWFLTGNSPTRKGNGQPNAAPAADLVAVNDGYIVLSAYMPHQWSKLCRAIGRPELIDKPEFATANARCENRLGLLEVLGQALGDQSREEVVELLAAAGIVVGSIRDYPDAFAARSEIPGNIFLSCSVPDSPSRTFVGTPVDWDRLRPSAEPPRTLGAESHLLDHAPEEVWSVIAAVLEA